MGGEKKGKVWGELGEGGAGGWAGAAPLPPPEWHFPLSSPLLHMLLPLAALLLAASAAAPARAGTTTVDLYRNNAVLDNLGGKERPAKNVAVSFGGGGYGAGAQAHLVPPAPPRNPLPRRWVSAQAQRHGLTTCCWGRSA